MGTAKEPFSLAVEIGRRVRRQRVKLGITQEGLAERSGFHVTWISSVENGRRNLSVVSLVRLASALEVDPSRLVRGLGPEEPPTGNRSG